MTRLAAELNQVLFSEGEHAPIKGMFDLVDEDGNKQDFFKPVLMKENEQFPEVPQDGLFYSISADLLDPDFCIDFTQ